MNKFHAWMAAGLMAAQGAWAASPVVLDATSGTTFEQYSASTTVGIGAVNADNTLYFIDEGTVGTYQSWYIFYDPATPSNIEALLQFDQNIVAVYSKRSTIDATTPTYGAAGINYGSRGFTGLEGNDALTWTDNLLLLDWRSSDPGDHIRVLTLASPVPEPLSSGMLLGGLFAVAWLSRRRLNRAD